MEIYLISTTYVCYALLQLEHAFGIAASRSEQKGSLMFYVSRRADKCAVVHPFA